MDASTLDYAITLFVEATRGLRRAKVLLPLEKHLTKSMQRAFLAQGRRFVTLFRRAFRDSWLAEGLADDLDPLFTKSELDTVKLFQTPLRKNIAASLTAGALHNVGDLAIDMAFSLKNPRAVTYLERHGAALVTQINETTRASVQNLVLKAADEGWSYNKTASELVAKYKQFAIGKPQEHIDGRAHLIAITEIGNAYETGSFQVLQGLKDQGVDTEKRWFTMGDDKVSEGCRANEAVGWIMSTSAFPSGHMHPLRFPGCRCDFESRIVAGQPELPVAPEPLKGFKTKYGIDPDWTPEERTRFIDENLKFDIRTGGAATKARGVKATELIIRSRTEAVELLSRQPNTVVSSFLRKGKLFYADDAAFSKLRGVPDSKAYAFYDHFRNRIVMRSGKIGDVYQAQAFTHEIGHFVQSNSHAGVKFSQAYSANKAYDRFTGYAKFNDQEGFAESYLAWHTVESGQPLPSDFRGLERIGIADPRVREVFALVSQAVFGISK